jgi:hypothetical protein
MKMATTIFLIWMNLVIYLFAMPEGVGRSFAKVMNAYDATRANTGSR